MATLHDPILEADLGNSDAALWRLMALRGAIAVVLGVLALFWPLATLVTLVLVFAAYCVVDAIASTVLAVRGARRRRRGWWWPALNAVIALGAAAVAALYPGLTMFAFVVMLTVWALINGVVSIVGAFRVDARHGRWWLLTGGIVSVVLGVLLLLVPGAGLYALTWMFGFYALMAGATYLGLALRLRIRQRAEFEPGPRVGESAARDTARAVGH